jgi:ABC-type nitrate/sulfonate/bicarbonate transport system ATPase subunit
METLLSEFGVSLDLRLRPSECSGGMIQQAAIIRAFLHGPCILCADEPFSALDVRVASRIRAAFRKRVKSAGIVCVLILHDLESLIQVCDRVLVVPGRPYSTADIPDYHRTALLVNNATDLIRGPALEERSYVNIISDILGHAEK